MIQMETSLFEARCCLRTPLKRPSPGINQWPGPRAGKAAVTPRSEALGRVRHPGTSAMVVPPGARPPATLPQPWNVFKCLLMALPGHFFLDLPCKTNCPEPNCRIYHPRMNCCFLVSFYNAGNFDPQPSISGASRFP